MGTHEIAIQVLTDQIARHQIDVTRAEERVAYRGRLLSEADTASRIAKAAEDLKRSEGMADTHREIIAALTKSVEVLRDSEQGA